MIAALLCDGKPRGAEHGRSLCSGAGEGPASRPDRREARPDAARSARGARRSRLGGQLLRALADVARRRERGKARQATIDPRRLVFIGETWAETNMMRQRRAPETVRYLVCGATVTPMEGGYAIKKETLDDLLDGRDPEQVFSKDRPAPNAKLRRAVRTRGHFPTDDPATKLLFLAMMFDERFVQA